MDMQRIRWATLAVFVSGTSLIIFSHGLHFGGSAVTAAILAGTTIALFVLGDWQSIESDFWDICFMAFAGYIALSIMSHPRPDPKELALLIMSLLGYPAGRLFRVPAIDPIFAKIVLVIVAIGAMTIVAALASGEVTGLGKPKVFGDLSEAPPIFMVPFVLAVGAMLARDKIKFGLVSGAVIAALTFVFAAAMVRFTFVAAIVAAATLGFVSSRAMRRLMLIGAGACIIVIAAGQIARPSTAMLYVNFVAQTLGVGSSSVPPGVAPAVGAECQTIDENNSIEVRMQLYREWLRLITESDLTGIGLDGFKQKSCRPNEEVHNDTLQIALEFGWPAAGLFASLVFAAFFRLFQAGREEVARFGLFSLCFLVLMSMVHGRVSRDAALFFFIGYAIQFGANARVPSFKALGKSA